MSFTPKLWAEADVITAAELNRLEDAMEFVVNGPVVVNAQTVSYELVLADAGKLITMDAAGATVLTVPANASVAFDVGTVVAVARLGAGTVTFAPAGGVTIHSASGFLAITPRYANAALTKLATNTWLLTGALA